MLDPEEEELKQYREPISAVFKDSESVCNKQARMIKFTMAELEHFVFMMFLYGTHNVQKYIEHSPVFHGLQHSYIKR